MRYLSFICFVLILSCHHSIIPPAQNSLVWHPLSTDEDLDVLIDEMRQAKIVLLGEASHGTSEFYSWRARIPQRLIREHGFNVIVTEGDWPFFRQVNEFINGQQQDSAAVLELLQRNTRWPSWLWNNREFANFAGWLNRFKQERELTINIYGMDVFGFTEAAAILASLDDSESKPLAIAARICLENAGSTSSAYQRFIRNGNKGCGALTEALYRKVIEKRETFPPGRRLDNILLASVAYNGELYFRMAVKERLGSWNIRARHMGAVIDSILAYHPQSKIIVWSHNTNIGNGAFTDMPGRGRTNVGQILKEKYGSKVFSVGFSTYGGSVIAARKWDGSVEEMTLPPAVSNSLDDLMNKAGAQDKIILSRELPPSYLKSITQRAIGVVEAPVGGQIGSYTPSVIPRRYDALIFINESHALHPLPVK